MLDETIRWSVSVSKLIGVGKEEGGGPYEELRRAAPIWPCLSSAADRVFFRHVVSGVVVSQAATLVIRFPRSR
jgi:hypothetical protein